MRPTRRQACAYFAAVIAHPVFAKAAPRSIPSHPEDVKGEIMSFLDAVVRGDLARVQQLLSEHKRLALATDSSGRSAYLLAHMNDHPAILPLLEEAIDDLDADLDVVEAVLAERWPRFEQLARETPELLDLAHPVGGTPLYGAALVGSLGLWRLRGAGCLSDAAPEGGTRFTPARGAMTSRRATWANIALTDLCSNGADVNAPQHEGSSVLHGAVLRRDVRLVRLAIRKGADVDATDDQGRTPRDVALELDWEEGERLLANHATLPRDHRTSRFALDANGDPIQRPDLFDVPQALQSEVTGASHMRLTRVQELVASDRRLVFSISSDDELAIEACAHIGNRPIIRFHLDHGAPLSLPTAVSLGDSDRVKFWLERDPMLIHERGAHDFPVMWYAAIGGGSVEMAEQLQAYDVPVDQESMGTTALHWAIRRQHRDLAAWLLEQGADAEAIGYRWHREGQSPLDVAIADGNSRMAEQLKSAGAKR